MCNTSQYLDYLDCKYKNKIIDLIVEKCVECDDNKTKLVNITYNKTNNKTYNKADNKADNKTIIVIKTVKSSCNVHIILTIASIVTSTVYTIYSVYYNWFLYTNKDSFTKYNTRKETLIY